jgi:hypothetical protein
MVVAVWTVALAGIAVWSWAPALTTERHLSAQPGECAQDDQITIMSPLPHETVGHKVSIVGTATVDQTCRYVNVYMKDYSHGITTNWRAADTVQVQGTGQWAATIWTYDVISGGEFDVQAHLSGQPVNLSPDMNGWPSTDLLLRRQ